MKKAMLPLVIASLIPATSFADVNLYGKAWLSFEKSDLQNGGSYTDVRNNESRLGVKGSEAINDDVKVIYQYELKIGADDGKLNTGCKATSTSVTTAPAATTKTSTNCSTDGSSFSQRNTFVGLQGTFGTAKLGMFDTPLKLAQEKTDVFKDLIGDWKNVFQGEIRASNIIQYSTPTMSNFTGNVAYVSSEGDADGQVTSGYSASAVYDTKLFYVALANEHNIKNAMDKVITNIDTDTLRLVGRVNLGQFTVGAMFETYDNGVANSQGDEKKDGFMVSGIYDLNATWALKAQYGASDMIAEGGKTASFGADYKLSKNAKVTGYFTSLKDDGIDSKSNAFDITKQHDDKWIGVALEYTF